MGHSGHGLPSIVWPGGEREILVVEISGAKSEGVLRSQSSLFVLLSRTERPVQMGNQRDKHYMLWLLK